MRFSLIIISFILFNQVFGQKNPIGLYGDCSGKYDGYICQQLLIEKDRTFKFYDLLHLAGWRVSEGSWRVNNDTLILNSNNPLNRPQYKVYGYNKTDSLNVFIYGEDGPLAFVNISIDSLIFISDTSGFTTIPKAYDKQLYFSYVGYMSERIKFKKDEIINSDTLKIKLFQGINEGVLFHDEKWLIRDNKVYHSPDISSSYDSSAYFEKVPIKELKYREDY